MSDSIYAPPEADVSAPTDDQPRYYVVAPFKFVLLSMLTLTLYFVYWFYRNWRQINVDDNDDLWPVARGIFYIFFTHSLFTDVQESLKTQGREFKWQPGLLAAVFIIVTIVANVFDYFVPYDDFPVLSGLMPMIATTLTTLLLLPAQKAINFASEDVGGKSNSRLTMANWGWMILGGLLWLMLLLGTAAMMLDPTLQ